MITIQVDFGQGGKEEVEIKPEDIETTNYDDDLIMTREFFYRMREQEQRLFLTDIDLEGME